MLIKHKACLAKVKEFPGINAFPDRELIGFGVSTLHPHGELLEGSAKRWVRCQLLPIGLWDPLG
jgi:hypothetical protein